MNCRKDGCVCWQKTKGDGKTCKPDKACLKRGGRCVGRDEVDNTVQVVGKCKPNCACVVDKAE